MSGYRGGWPYGPMPASNFRIPPEYIGIPREVLWQWFRACQIAMQQLTTGGKPVTVSYAQGDGSRSVTYTPAEMGKLEERTRDLARVLGLAGRRRAITVSF